MHPLNIFSSEEVQINQVQDVSQKITLHRPNSLSKVMDIKEFLCALIWWGNLKPVHFGAHAQEKNGTSCGNPSFNVPTNEPA